MLDKVILKGDLLEALLRKPPAEEDLRLILEVSQPADIGEVLAELTIEQQLLVLRCLGPEEAGEVLAEAPEETQKALLLTLIKGPGVARILNRIAPDEGADLVSLLPESAGEAALLNLEPEQAEAIRSLARHDPETAGGIMTTELVSVVPDLSISEALATLRTSLDQESIANVYVVKEDDRLVGVLSVRDILEADPEAAVSDVMVRDIVSARVDDDQEQASRLLDRYDFSSLPVVDESDRLLGIITIDDAMDVLEEEAEEDIGLIAGSGVVTARDPVLKHLRYRLPWLLVTMIGGLLAAVLLVQFDSTLNQIPELVFFLPVMLGMAGNVGIQSSTVMVRGFATGEMVLGMAKRTVLSQVVLGIVVGVICGTLTGTLAAVLTGRLDIGYAVAISMALGITGAAAAGTVLPIVCERMKIDPAVAAGPVITTMNDLLGLLIYFLIATLILMHSL